MNKKIIALCGFIFFGSSVSIKPLNFSWGEDDSPFSFSFDSSASVGAAESPDCAVSDEVAAVVIGPKDKITTLQEELRGLKASRTFYDTVGQTVLSDAEYKRRLSNYHAKCANAQQALAAALAERGIPSSEVLNVGEIPQAPYFDAKSSGYQWNKNSEYWCGVAAVTVVVAGYCLYRWYKKRHAKQELQKPVPASLPVFLAPSV